MEEKKLKGQTASIVEFIFGGLLVIGGIGNLALNPLNGLACIAFGAFLVVTGVQWRMLIKEYRTYMTVLSSDPTCSLTTIAQATNASNGTVKDNLKLMIKKGLAKGIVVDEQGNRVISGNSHPTSVAAPPSGSPVPVEMVAVTCSGCGAKNEIARGATGQCDHCGATIQA